MDNLKELQALPLADKVKLSQELIKEWYEHFNGKVAVSFSGGKDSTVLLKLVRDLYPDVPAVYCDVGINYPEVDAHIAATPNVTILKPDMDFRSIIEQFGFCYPNKNTATYIEPARRKVPFALQIFEGKNKAGEDRQIYQRFKRWKWLVDTDLKITDKCCNFIKLNPLKKYKAETGRKNFTGMMACESFRRLKTIKRCGCNNYNNETSSPLGFWNTQDALRYIVENNVKIPEVYGDIVPDKKGKLRCTGVNRTGCVFCPAGCSVNHKFQLMKKSHPDLYKFIMSELGLDKFLTAVGVDH